MSLLLKLTPFLVGEIASWAGGVAITHLWLSGNKTLHLWLSQKDGVSDWILIETDLRYLSKLPTYLAELKALKTVNLKLNAVLTNNPNVTLEWLQSLPRSITCLVLNFSSASRVWLTKKNRIDESYKRSNFSAQIDLENLFPDLRRFEMNVCDNFGPEYFKAFQCPPYLSVLDLRLVCSFDPAAWGALPITLTSLKLGLKQLPTGVDFKPFSDLRSLGLPRLKAITDKQIGSLARSVEYLDLGKFRFRATNAGNVSNATNVALLPPRLLHLKVRELKADQIKNWIDSAKSRKSKKRDAKQLSLKILDCHMTDATEFPPSLEELSVGYDTSTDTIIQLASKLPPNLQILNLANPKDLPMDVFKLLPKSLTKLGFRIKDFEKLEEIASNLDLPLLTCLTISFVPQAIELEPVQSYILEWLEILPSSIKTVYLVSSTYHRLFSHPLGYHGWYSLADALEEGDTALAEHLISLGMHTTLEKRGVDLARVCIQRGFSETLELIMKYTTLQTELASLKTEAISVGNIEMFKILNRAQANDLYLVNGPDADLLDAVKYGQLEVAEWLVQDPVTKMMMRSLIWNLYDLTFEFHQYRMLAWLCLQTNTKISFRRFIKSMETCPWQYGQTDPCPPLTILEEMGVSYPYGHLLRAIDYNDDMPGLINSIRAWLNLRQIKY